LYRNANIKKCNKEEKIGNRIVQKVMNKVRKYNRRKKRKE